MRRGLLAPPDLPGRRPAPPGCRCCSRRYAWRVASAANLFKHSACTTEVHSCTAQMIRVLVRVCASRRRRGPLRPLIRAATPSRPPVCVLLQHTRRRRWAGLARRWGAGTGARGSGARCCVRQPVAGLGAGGHQGDPSFHGEHCARACCASLPPRPGVCVPRSEPWLEAAACWLSATELVAQVEA
jgi:hypothetical protein